MHVMYVHVCYIFIGSKYFLSCSGANCDIVYWATVSKFAKCKYSVVFVYDSCSMIC